MIKTHNIAADLYAIGIAEKIANYRQRALELYYILRGRIKNTYLNFHVIHNVHTGVVMSDAAFFLPSSPGKVIYLRVHLKRFSKIDDPQYGNFTQKMIEAYLKSTFHFIKIKSLKSKQLCLKNSKSGGRSSLKT